MKTAMKTMIAGFAAVAATLMLAPGFAAAQNSDKDLVDQAKAAGVVGERADGLLGFVASSPAAGSPLAGAVGNINIQRRDLYRRYATERTPAQTADQWAATFAVTVIQGLPNGYYLNDQTATWCQKSAATQVRVEDDGSIVIRCR